MEKLDSLETLKTFITSSMAFARYLESYGVNNDMGKYFCDINHLKVITASFQLFLHKEDIIEKDNNNLKSKIDLNMLEQYVRIIGKKTIDGKWYIGGGILNSIEEVVNVVRNKLAHGDFKVNGNYVEFEYNEQEYKIEINKLVHFINLLCHFWDLSKVTGENVRTLVAETLYLDKSLNNIKGKSKFERALNHINIIEIKNRPILGHKRSYTDSLAIERFIEEIKNKVNKKENYHSYYLKCKEEFKKIGIDLEIITYKVSELNADKKEYLEEIYFQNQSHFKHYDFATQINVLVHWVYEVVKAKDTKKNILFACTSNQEMFKILEKNSSMKLRDVFAASPNSTNMYNYYPQQVVANYLLIFYTIYQFGLDNIYKTGETDLLSDIIDKNKVNFAKLDLSKINPCVNKIEHKSTCYDDQINKVKRDFDDSLISLQKLEKQFNQYHLKLMNQDVPEEEFKNDQRYNIIKNNYMNAKNHSKNLLETYMRYDEFMTNDYGKHVINREIITHIRNSIAHGNVEMKICNEYFATANDIIIFKDIHEGKLTFELEISVKDFVSLFSLDNLDILYEFINNEVDKEIEKTKIKKHV